MVATFRTQMLCCRVGHRCAECQNTEYFFAECHSTECGKDDCRCVDCLLCSVTLLAHNLLWFKHKK
jgi:hypothetical protein